MPSDRLHIAPDIRHALAAGAPVVALETAVLTHGLPPPHHLAAVQRMAAAVRDAGAHPAVVAALDGRLHVGLADPDLLRLADLAAQGRAVKVAARDLARALALGHPGGTTVGATLVACRLAHIPVFATGGIGGVHRGWADHLDVSGDLLELARAPTVVVSAGAKSILDLPATLEALEALGVPVLGWRCDRLPRFHAPPQGDLPIPRVDDLAVVADLCRIRWRDLDQRAGVLLANPLDPALALDPAEHDAALAAALDRARAQGVAGPALTPFLLGELADGTGGRSLHANLALLEANAALAARLARALAAA